VASPHPYYQADIATGAFVVRTSIVNYTDSSGQAHIDWVLPSKINFIHVALRISHKKSDFNHKSNKYRIF